MIYQVFTEIFHKYSFYAINTQFMVIYDKTHPKGPEKNHNSKPQKYAATGQCQYFPCEKLCEYEGEYNKYLWPTA